MAFSHRGSKERLVVSFPKPLVQPLLFSSLPFSCSEVGRQWWFPVAFFWDPTIHFQKWDRFKEQALNFKVALSSDECLEVRSDSKNIIQDVSGCFCLTMMVSSPKFGSAWRICTFFLSRWPEVLFSSVVLGRRRSNKLWIWFLSHSRPSEYIGECASSLWGLFWSVLTGAQVSSIDDGFDYSEIAC